MINKKLLTVIVLLASTMLLGCDNVTDVGSISELEEIEDSIALSDSNAIDISGKNFDKKAKELLTNREFTEEDAFNIVKEKFKDLLSKNPEFYIVPGVKVDENGQKYYEGSLDKRYIKVYENGKVYNVVGEWKTDD